MSSWSERSKPGQDIGTILLAGKSCRLVVGGLLGQRVDRGAADLGGRDQAVGMERDEQLAAALVRDVQPVAQPDDAIRIASHDHLIAAGGFQLPAHLEAHPEHDVLLVVAPGADRPGIDPAVAGVDHDDPLAGRRRYLLRRRWRDRRHRREALPVDAVRAGRDRRCAAAGPGRSRSDSRGHRRGAARTPCGSRTAARDRARSATRRRESGRTGSPGPDRSSQRRLAGGTSQATSGRSIASRGGCSSLRWRKLTRRLRSITTLMPSP